MRGGRSAVRMIRGRSGVFFWRLSTDSHQKGNPTIIELTDLREKVFDSATGTTGLGEDGAGAFSFNPNPLGRGLGAAGWGQRLPRPAAQPNPPPPHDRHPARGRPLEWAGEHLHPRRPSSPSHLRPARPSGLRRGFAGSRWGWGGGRVPPQKLITLKVSFKVRVSAGFARREKAGKAKIYAPIEPKLRAGTVPFHLLQLKYFKKLCIAAFSPRTLGPPQVTFPEAGLGRPTRGPLPPPPPTPRPPTSWRATWWWAGRGHGPFTSCPEGRCVAPPPPSPESLMRGPD